MLHRPLQQLQMSFLLGVVARPIVPRAMVCPRPLQQLQAPTLCGDRTRLTGSPAPEAT